MPSWAKDYQRRRPRHPSPPDVGHDSATARKVPHFPAESCPHRSGTLPHFKRNQCPTSTGIRTFTPGLISSFAEAFVVRLMRADPTPLPRALEARDKRHHCRHLVIQRAASFW